jgi:HNH endonuclease
MHTHIGTITLAYFAETAATSLSYADTQAQASIAERAGWTRRSAERIRSGLLAALERDGRFTKGFAHVAINGQARKVRVYHVAGIPQPAAPTSPLFLPSDPWRRRQFIGSMLDIDPRSVTEAHAGAVLAVLPNGMARLPPKQRDRITAVFGLDGQPAIAYADRAEAEQRGALTIRSSIRDAMHTLRAIVRTEVLNTAGSTAIPAPLPGNPLFWERVDRSGDCWLWTGTLDNGYPVFKRNGKKHMATRYVYELFYGPIPEGHHITHSCQEINTRCMRPEHLVASLPSKTTGSPLRARRA